MLNLSSFTDEELQLLLELLEAERHELPPEIRRIDNPRIHDELLHRLDQVDNLIEKLHHAPVH